MNTEVCPDIEFDYEVLDLQKYSEYLDYANFKF